MTVAKLVALLRFFLLADREQKPLTVEKILLGKSGISCQIVCIDLGPLSLCHPPIQALPSEIIPIENQKRTKTKDDKAEFSNPTRAVKRKELIFFRASPRGEDETLHLHSGSFFVLAWQNS